MKQFLIIPKQNSMQKSLELAEKYNLGFEYNDFFMPDVLDNTEKTDEIIGRYKQDPLPGYCTLHGAFFDVTVFSPDSRIREISDMRIRQSISAAEKIGAAAVVFHTNYNPFLNSKQYIGTWINDNAEYWSNILSEYPNMNIYLENMFDSSPDIMEALAEKLCGYKNFGICLDYAHAALTPVPTDVWVRRLCRYVKHIHINDNDLISDLHLAAGDGKINWDRFYELYDKYMNGSSILIETSSVEYQERSISKLIADGFMEI